MDQNNFLKVDRKELIKTFSDIDDKINNLHEKSSADFLQLNNYLKDYYRKTNTVSENAFRILETIAGKSDINLIEELESIYHRLEATREKIKEDDTVKIQILRDVALKANQLNIALRNIKQDLTSFKFLSTNYSFISNYEDAEARWIKELEPWNNDIITLQSAISSISSQIDRFREQIVYNIDHLELKIEKSLRIFMSLSKETKVNIEIVVQKNHESKLHFPILKEKTVNSSKSINNIITHLQYQDIIRQKIEHIQSSHAKIINDLNESIARKDIEMARIAEDYRKIGDIAGLQAAQLLLVSKEYQNALDVIMRNFQGIAEDLTAISNISSDFSYKDNNSEVTLLKQIRNKLDEGIIMLDLNNFRGMNAEYLSAKKKIDAIAETFVRNISDPLKKLDKFEKINGSKNTDDRPTILLQVSSLSREINKKIKDISEKTLDLQKLTEKLSFIDNIQDFGSQLEQDRIKLMVDISRILDNLDKDNEELDNVLMQNRDLNNYILEKIEGVINRVDYYEYFENIVEQVIAQLNTINHRLKISSDEENMDEKAENLKDIKKSYTMESERVIHNKVISGDEIPEAPPADKPEDDIEFF